MLFRTLPMRACSSALAFSTTAGGVARIDRDTVDRANRVAAQKMKSDLRAVLNRNSVPAGVFIGGSSPGRGVKVAGTRRIIALHRSGYLNANCMEDGAPAEAPTTAARLILSASNRQACASACADA